MLDMFTDSVKDGNKYYILYLFLLLIFSFVKYAKFIIKELILHQYRLNKFVSFWVK